MLSRRQLLTLSALLATAGSPARARATQTIRKQQADEHANGPAVLEVAVGGRLGCCLYQVGKGALAGHRADERFAMCSTFKLPLAAMVLAKADAGAIALDETLAIVEADAIPHMPVTAAFLGKRMTVAALAQAAQTTSDNLAANLLMKHLGGPHALTRFYREHGDSLTRSDRYEPELNLVVGSDQRDTTTPAAMAELVARIFSSETLSASSKDKLKSWCIETKTGLKRLRAGLPRHCVAGDKTGTALHSSMPNQHNDVALIWHGETLRYVLASYYQADQAYPEMQPGHDAIHADVAAWAATHLSC
jgi:beta-lactamase class A